MSVKAAKWIFIIGTVISAVIFLGLTADTHRQVATLTNASQLSDNVVAGKKVWHKYNCNDCHTILGFGGYYAPDMTRVHSRIGGQRIMEVVKNPEKYTTWRKMPHYNISDEELNNLAAFFKWTDGIQNNDWPPQDSAERHKALTQGSLMVSSGAALVKEKGCLNCHTLQGAGVNEGPPLDNLSLKWEKEKLTCFLLDPEKEKPAVTMPNPNLKNDEAESLADFILSLQKGGK